jgi:hypothetical protein
MDRRTLLRRAACGFGSLALAGLAANPAAAGTGGANPLSDRPPLLPARVKRVIFVFMQGGPSHVDTFDYKPTLARYHGQKLHFRDSRKLANTGMSGEETVMQALWPFHQYGECGRQVSELFPHVAQCVDDLCFLHGMHTEGVAHGPSTLFLHTGATNLVRPSVGAWISYGLGSENQNLPGFVTICPSSGNGGPRNFSNAFLPPVYQGTSIGRAGQPARDARILDLDNPQLSLDQQREQFELTRSLNAAQTSGRQDDELQAVIASYELAWRMQMHAPGIMDLSEETPATQQMYGIGTKETDDFGRQCLLARRLAEAGVRFIQVSYADNGVNPRWDQHSNMPQHAVHARASDQPIAALIQDLRQRGLLDDTLVWWGGEFGRNPFAQGNGTGRDHNPRGFTHFLAGGGVKAGFAFGATDEFGHEAVHGKVHMHDLHATVLHLLGIDHERLTYQYAGRNFRLTDVAGRVVHDILA